LETKKQRDLSCKEAARLLSKRRDLALIDEDEKSLEHHLSLCVNCRNFDQQMDVLSELAKLFAEQKHIPK
jgi:predicted anti-sigma-YlaC factor YlaD